MDLANYKRRKGLKSVILQRTGPGQFVLVARRWDPESGVELTSEQISCNQGNVEQLRCKAEFDVGYQRNLLLSCEELVADMAALEKAVATPDKKLVKKSR